MSSTPESSVVTWKSRGTGNNPDALIAIGSTESIGSISGTFGAIIEAIVRIGGTVDADVQFRWAQNNATAQDNKVLKDSYLTYKELQ